MKTWGVSHRSLAIYIKKYLKAKEELPKLKYFTMQKYNLQKNSLKKNQNLSRYYYNSIINLKFQHKAKISSVKNPHIKLNLLLRGQNPLSYLVPILYDESKHNILAYQGKANKGNMIRYMIIKLPTY
jgi:hypothetical protein